MLIVTAPFLDPSAFASILSRSITWDWRGSEHHAHLLNEWGGGRPGAFCKDISLVSAAARHSELPLLNTSVSHSLCSLSLDQLSAEAPSWVCVMSVSLDMHAVRCCSCLPSVTVSPCPWDSPLKALSRKPEMEVASHLYKLHFEPLIIKIWMSWRGFG